jgi:outer membrane receptor protein involved in Fe transport
MPSRRSFISVCLALASATAPPILSAQEAGTVRGAITNAASATPVVGAQVFIVGTRLGAASGADGRYSFGGVPAGTHTVRLRALGYQPQEKTVTVALGAAATLDFALSSAPVSLDEVVVTGTAGAARKREVGNSIGQIKLSETPEVPTNVSNLLAGKLAGVNVSGGVGNSGGGAAIRLRGTTSVALTNQPLVYVDGVRTRSDAYPRNGIFFGTTQRGANSNSSPLNDINPDDIDRIEIVKGAAAATLYGTDAAAGVIQIFTKRGAQGAARWSSTLTTGIATLQPFGTDSVPRMFMEPFLRNSKERSAFFDNYAQRLGGSAQVTGGSADVRYFLSGSADRVDGVLPNDREKKYGVRGNVDFQPARNLAMSWNTAYTNNAISNSPAGNNAQGVTLNAFRRDRNYYASDDPDVIRRVFEQELLSTIDRFLTGATATFTPIANFSSRFTVGYDRAAVENRNLRPYGFAGQPRGFIQNQRWANTTYSTDWVNNYDWNVNSDFKVTASAGTQYVNSLVADVVGASENFPSPTEATVATGAIKYADENRQTVITGGAFGQALLGYKDRYFVTVGGRIDGNSAFGKNFGFQTYPKISGSWVISEESFWKPALGTLKLRSAFGAAGRAPGAFASVQTWDPVGWGPSAAVRPLNLGNPDLGPERTTELEVGFDGSLFDGRLTVDFTWFRAKTTDALFNVRSIPTNGFLNSVLTNVGEMEKSGIETAIVGTLFDRPRFGLTAGLNVSTNDSKVLSLGGAQSFTVGNSGWVVEGQPAPVIRGKIIRNPDAVGVAPDTASNHYFGPSQPTLIVGGSLNLRTWRNISVALRGEYQGGAYIQEDASYQALSRSVLWPTCFDAYAKQAASQALTVEETLKCIPANVRSDMFIFPADFFKLRDLTVTIPLGRLIPGTASSSFVFSAQNFFRKNYGMPLFDPEMSGNDGFNATVRYISEHIPGSATYLTSLRISY